MHITFTTNAGVEITAHLKNIRLDKDCDNCCSIYESRFNTVILHGITNTEYDRILSLLKRLGKRV